MEYRTSRHDCPPGTLDDERSNGHANVDPICKLIKHRMHSFNIIDASKIYELFLEKNITALKRAMCLPDDHNVKNFNILIYDLPLTKELFSWIEHLEKIGFNGCFLYMDHHKNESDGERYDLIQKKSWAIIDTRENWPSALYGIIQNKKRVLSEINPLFPVLHFYGSDFDGINSACAVAYEFNEPEDGFFESVHKADSNNRFIITTPIIGEKVTEQNLKSLLTPTAQLIDEGLKSIGKNFEDRKNFTKQILSFYEKRSIDDDIKKHLIERQEKYKSTKQKETLDCFNEILNNSLDKTTYNIQVCFVSKPIDISLFGTLITNILPRTIVIIYNVYPSPTPDMQKHTVLMNKKVMYCKHETNLPKVSIEFFDKSEMLDVVNTKILYNKNYFEDFNSFFIESIKGLNYSDFSFEPKDHYGLDGRTTFIATGFQIKNKIIEIIKNTIKSYLYQYQSQQY